MSHGVRILLVVGLAATLPAARSAPGPTQPRVGRVVGVVLDSLAGGVPLAGAHVQLVAAGGAHEVVRSADSDGEGRFVLDSVPEGRYQIGFLHPLLDSMGLESPVRAVVVSGAEPVYVDLFTPSAARYRAAVCGASGGEAPAVLAGVARRASDGLPVEGAVVTAEWFEVAIGRGTIGQRLAGAMDTTRAGGWFALCGVPQEGTVVLEAKHPGGGTDRVETEIPKFGLAKRDLYLGEARDEQKRRRGDGRITGKVVAAEDQRPIPGAQVAIAGGPVAVADAAGDWTLAGVPSGTRELQVRAIGRAPRSLAVDVVPAAPPVRVALSSTRAVLDTIRVRADRTRLATTGFDERRRTAGGRYLTGEDLARRPIMYTSEIFQTVPGMRVTRTDSGTALTMRGPFGDCVPAVFVDGQDMRVQSADDLDAFVAPENVAGIEIYAGTAVPPEFQGGMTGCGSVVIWTRPLKTPRKKR